MRRPHGQDLVGSPGCKGQDGQTSPVPALGPERATDCCRVCKVPRGRRGGGERASCPGGGASSAADRDCSPPPAPCLASPRLPPPPCSGVCVRKIEWVRPGHGGRAGPGPDPCRERRPEGSAPCRGVSCPWGLHPQHELRMGGVGAGPPPHVASYTQGSQTASRAPSLALLGAPVTLAAGSPGASHLDGPGASWRLGSRLLQRL